MQTELISKITNEKKDKALVLLPLHKHLIKSYFNKESNNLFFASIMYIKLVATLSFRLSIRSDHKNVQTINRQPPSRIKNA